MVTLSARAITIAGLAALGVAVAAYFVGRSRAPVRVEERTREVKVIDQEAIQRAVTEAHAEWSRSENVRTVTRIVYRDGKPVEKVIYRDREVAAAGRVESSSAQDTRVTTHARDERETETVTVYARPSWRVAGQLGWELGAPSLRPQVFGGEVSRQIVGPVWLGLWARTDSTAGLSLALEW